VKTFTGPAPDASECWTREWRQADIGAANGHGNARSVARVQSLVTNGGEVDGVQLLSPATIDRIFDVQSDNVDIVLGVPERFGLGYGLPCEGMPFPLDAKICFWGGWGGSMIVNDLEHGMTVAYMMNRMEAGLVGDARGFDLLAAAFAAVS
jgi:CubicO group peptidase (beta-lactamase class C family)